MRPGAFQLAAKSMGKTTKELGKMLELGQVMATELLPKLSLELMKTFRPTEEMLNGPQASIGRMNQAFIELAKVIGDSGLSAALVKVADKLEAFAKSDAAVELGKKLGTALEFLADHFSEITTGIGIFLGLLTVRTAWNTATDSFNMLKTAAVGFSSSLAAIGIDTEKLNKLLKGTVAVLASFGAGFAIGTWLADQFVEARIAGAILLESILDIWEGIKLGGKVVYAGLQIVTLSALGVMSGSWYKFQGFVVGVLDKVAEKLEGVFNSDFVKASSSKLDDFFGTNMFSKASNAASNFFGKTIAGKLDETKKNIDDAFSLNDKVYFGGVENSINDINKAWADYTANIKTNKNIFADIQEQMIKEGEEAKRLGIRIGDLEEYKRNLAKADLEAAEAAKRLSDAEAERAERIKVLETAVTKNAGLASLDKIKAALDIVASAEGKVDPTIATINKINKEIAILSTTMADTPENTKKMAASLAILKKELGGYKKEISSVKQGDADGEFNRLTQAIDDTQTQIDLLNTGLSSYPEVVRKFKAVLELLHKESVRASRSDAQIAFDKVSDSLAEETDQIENNIYWLNKLGDAELAAVATKAMLMKVSNDGSVMLDSEVLKLVEAAKKTRDLNDELERSKKLSGVFKGLLDGIGGLGDELVTGLATGDWKSLGNTIATSLTDAMSSILEVGLTDVLSSSLGALAGPLGALAGGIVGSLVKGIGGGLFGSKIEDPTAALQASQGTGTVLGDSSAKSESIRKSLDLIASTNEKIVNINTGMLKALNNLTGQIGKGATLIAKNSGQDGIVAPSVASSVFDGDSPLTAGVAGAVANISTGLFDGGLSALAGVLQGFNGFVGKIGNFVVSVSDILTIGLFDKIGKWFGGSSKKIDEGIVILGGNIRDVVDNTIVEAFGTFKTKEYKFSSNKVGDQTALLDDETTDQFSLIFSSIIDTVTAGATALGVSADDIKTRIDAFEIDTTKISLEGLSADDKVAALETVFSSIFDELTLAVLPFITQFQETSETMGDAVARLSTEFALAKEAYASLGFQVGDSLGDLNPALNSLGRFGETMGKLPIPTELFIKAADDLINAVGGIDAFSEAMSSFEKNFLSEAENFSNLSRRLGSAMGDLPLPETRDGFVDLLKAQDAMTASGQANIATILKLQGAADSYYDTLEGWSTKISDKFMELNNTPIPTESLTAYIDQIKAGTISIDDLVASMVSLDGSVTSASKGLADKRALELRLLKLTGTEQQYLTAIREDEVASMADLSNSIEAIDLLNRIYAEEDLAAATAKTTKETDEATAREKRLADARRDSVQAASDAFFATGFKAGTGNVSDLTQEQIDTASTDLVGRVGDISAFNSAVNTFSSNFITAEAVLSRSTSNLTDKFAEYGMTVPATRAAFTELYQSMDAMTEGGREGIAVLLQLTDDANIYYRAQEALASSLYDLNTRLYKAQGKDLLVLSRTRDKELASVSASEQAILLQIYAAEDLNTLREEEAKITDQLAGVKDRLNSAYKDEISNLENVRNTMKGLGQSLKDFSTDLSIGDLSTLSPQDQLKEAKKQFELTASAAQSGDQTALGRLQDVANTFLQESRDFQGSGGTFAADFARVQEVVSNSASVADLQASQAERQRVLLERQLQRQEENNAETQSIKEALLALIAVQKESGVLSITELNAMRASLAILESNSSLATSR